MVLRAEQIARMSRLLDDALPLDAAARLRWLEGLAPEDRPLVPALRQALLPTEADGRSDSIDLETLPKIDDGHGPPSVPASGLAAGGRVGPYHLVRLLGAGGMAEVWLAHRTDSTAVQEVALKVPILSGYRPDLQQRFARECEILARLEHPHIVRFQDAGFSDDGLPYVAMERVAGEPLTDWCDRRRLGLRERITLFLQVLDAVQHAHARQVIHRDLKPANILVTDEGEVQLLDFGAAKLLSKHYEREAQVTRLYGPALTPNYASPEVVRGESLATTSDIYSLGVVLYELLTGSRPYRIRSGSSCPQVEHAISTARIVRPSARSTCEACDARATSKNAMVHELRGELDAIVLKALSRAPQKRYSSVSALAADLQRHLGGQPARALFDRLPYRVANFLYRYSTDIAIALPVLALTVAVNVARLWQ